MPFRVLQFSDIHFSTKPVDDWIPHDDVRAQVLQDLSTFNASPVDAIVIAGDIAKAGKRSEYVSAANWLEAIRHLTGCPRSSVLLVPGNHDVDRDRIKVSTKLIHRSLRSSGLPQAIAELANLAAGDDPCLIEKVSAYQTFAASYGCFFRAPCTPSWHRTFQLATNRALRFHGLSTVQVCDEGDGKDAMLLGRHQFIFPREAGIEHVVVMHHPPEWLRDRSEALDYINSRARILIAGHEHRQDLQKITTPAKDERLLIASGALTPPDAAAPFLYRYNLLEFDTPQDGPPSLAVTVFPRIWSTQHTAFRPDFDCLNGGVSTTIELRCPQFGPWAGAAPPQPSDDAVCELRYLFWRHLEWDQRLRVLMDTKLLPPTPSTPLPHRVEEQALEGTASPNALHKLWAAVMTCLPDAHKKPNPFPSEG